MHTNRCMSRTHGSSFGTVDVFLMQALVAGFEQILVIWTVAARWELRSLKLATKRRRLPIFRSDLKANRTRPGANIPLQRPMLPEHPLIQSPATDCKAAVTTYSGYGLFIAGQRAKGGGVQSALKRMKSRCCRSGKDNALLKRGVRHPTTRLAW